MRLNRVMSFVLCCFGTSMAGSSFGAGDQQFEEWIDWQRQRSTTYMEANLSPEGTLPGTVVASLSKSEPDYFYHWTRDAALVVQTMLLEPADTDFDSFYKDYALLAKRQQLSDAYGGLGEPKFYVNGAPYKGAWGRPQNDGPALRAMALVDFAENLLDEGQKAFVDDLLYRPSLSEHSVIKGDLEYVSHNLEGPDFDLWEEVQGYHFFTRIAQRKAMLKGARLAEAMNDPLAAEWYRLKAMRLEALLQDHLNFDGGYILSTVGRVGGLDTKKGLDSSTILALIYTEDGEDSFLQLNDERVQQNAVTLINTFKDLYRINQEDAEGMAPGMGRYPEDTYDGYNTSGTGNPWFLINHGFAEYFYRLGSLYLAQDIFQPAKSFAPMVALLKDETGKNLDIFHLQDQPDNGQALFVEALMAMGDRFLQRSRFHSGDAGEFAEQFNRQTGFAQGAPNLTWSHSSFLRASSARSKLESALGR